MLFLICESVCESSSVNVAHSLKYQPIDPKILDEPKDHLNLNW